MKKLITLTGALILAACSGGDNTAVEAAEYTSADETAATKTDSPLVGTYGAITEDGDPWTSRINADGTYEDTVAGEVTETGTWTHVDDEICFEQAVTAGETADITCLALLDVSADGALHLRDPDGNEMNVPKL